jgi:hypothetical protein
MTVLSSAPNIGDHGRERSIWMVEVSGESKSLAPPAATSNSPTRGQVKLPHLTAAGGSCLRDAGALGKRLSSFLESPALTFELQQVASVHHAIQQRRDHDYVSQKLRPVFHEPV